MLLPQKVIRKLNVPVKRKIGVSVVFTFGIPACIVAILQLAETVIYATNLDYTYTFSGMILCSAAELTCGIFVLCILGLQQQTCGDRMRMVCQEVEA
ncbi:hypothetical protein F4821DRAFT_194554 [Hypoxylon rubiginosum]|uniref:Uncharacterized protein n=1 Tax=Hypoxylon rubiginosum TaxID=110542 RepID=A0ACC0CT89_9PEZI|nr:hypothetical protein F4821DRAFT_194554 [Hypoxylon rubiginosum]